MFKDNFYKFTIGDQCLYIKREAVKWWLGPWPWDLSIPAIDPAIAGMVLQPKFYGGIFSRDDVPSLEHSKLCLHHRVPAAFDGVAPTFSEYLGWLCDGTNWLATHYSVAEFGQDHAMFTAVNNPGGANCYACGAWTTTLNGGVYTAHIVGTTGRGVRNCSDNYNSTGTPAGVIGFSGRRVFIDGAYHGEAAALTNPEPLPLYLMALNVNSSPLGLASGEFTAGVWYTDVISDDQARMVSQALEIIRSA